MSSLIGTTFLIPLVVKEDENSAVAWFKVDEAVEKSNEEWFKEHIYQKLNKKFKELYG